MGNRKVTVSYPPFLSIQGLGLVPLPVGLSTQFVVSWDDNDERRKLLKWLSSSSFERHLIIYDALDAINTLLLAFKMAHVGTLDGLRVRTVGEGDVLFSVVETDEGHKDLRVLLDLIGKVDPAATALAIQELNSEGHPLDKKYLRCYDLLEQGMYTEAFLIAFTILDDLIQQILHDKLEVKGIVQRSERNKIMRGIKDDRLKTFLGPLLKAITGIELMDVWQDARKALEWLNTKRNNIAHGGHTVNYSVASQGIFTCIKVLVTLQQNGLIADEFTIPFFRHAKLKAAWTIDPPKWIPSGPVAESMDMKS